MTTPLGNSTITISKSRRRNGSNTKMTPTNQSFHIYKSFERKNGTMRNPNESNVVSAYSFIVSVTNIN